MKLSRPFLPAVLRSNLPTVGRLPLPLILLAGLSCFFADSLRAQSVTFAGSQPSVNFGTVNLCPSGATTPAPCSETLTLSYHVTAGGTLGTPKVLTLGSPNLDFTLASGSTCTGNVIQGNSCTVNVKFAPLYAGSRPGAVQTTDGSGNVLATTLIYGSGDGPQIGFEPGDSTTLSISLQGPLDMAVDGAGNLFIADTESGSVIKAPAGGGATTVINTGIGSPQGIAVDGAGNLFVAGAFDNKVIEVAAGEDTPITLPFSIPSGFADGVPIGLAVNAAGDIFVTDQTDVLELPVGGPQITLPFSGLNNPHGLAVDAAGDVFVADGYNNRVVELPAVGGAQITIATGLMNPFGLKTDGVGDVFIADINNNRVVEIPAGNGAPVTLGPGYPQPTGIALDSAGDLFVAVLYYGFYPSTTLISEIRRSQPPALIFGTLALGNSATLPLTVTNTGTGTLTVTPVFGSTDYRIASSNPANCLKGIKTGESCTVQIEFSPASSGELSSGLTLQTNMETGTVNPQVKLQGAGVGTGVGAIAAPVINLPSGVYKTPQTVVITDLTPGVRIYYTTDGASPTTASTLYTGAISVASSEALKAIAVLGSSSSAIANATYAVSGPASGSVINFSGGFSQASGPMAFNGSAGVDGSRLQLTSGGPFEAGSAFYAVPVDVHSFTTMFTFQLSDPLADGFTFTIQGVGPNTLGSPADGLGYKGIGDSLAIKFDLHNNSGEGPNSTGAFSNGILPTTPAIDLTGTGIDLHSGHIMLAQIRYDGVDVFLTLTDTVTLATWSTPPGNSFYVDVPGISGGSAAYVGFTGGTGAFTANQEILSWTYVSGPVGNDFNAPVSAPPLASPLPSFPTGFTTGGMTTNGSASISGTALQLTDGGKFEAGTAFYALPLNVQSFTSDFTFQLTNPLADGITFTIQNAFEGTLGNADLGALGGHGESLGYAGIPYNSVALKFDLHNDSGEGPDSTGLYTGGVLPTIPSINLTGTGIDLHSGHPFKAHITYDGTHLGLTLTDTVTSAAWSHAFAIDIPGTVVGNTAYIGFTGATGFETATQKILSWTFTNP